MEWREWLGRRIFVQLKTGAVYSGIIKDVDDFFITIKDKYNMTVTFAIAEILKIKEEKE